MKTCLCLALSSLISPSLLLAVSGLSQAAAHNVALLGDDREYMGCRVLLVSADPR